MLVSHVSQVFIVENGNTNVMIYNQTDSYLYNSDTQKNVQTHNNRFKFHWFYRRTDATKETHSLE